VLAADPKRINQRRRRPDRRGPRGREPHPRHGHPPQQANRGVGSRALASPPSIPPRTRAARGIRRSGAAFTDRRPPMPGDHPASALRRQPGDAATAASFYLVVRNTLTASTSNRAKVGPQGPARPRQPRATCRQNSHEKWRAIIQCTSPPRKVCTHASEGGRASCQDCEPTERIITWSPFSLQEAPVSRLTPLPPSRRRRAHSSTSQCPAEHRPIGRRPVDVAEALQFGELVCDVLVLDFGLGC